jgi:hypothetical protein
MDEDAPYSVFSDPYWTDEKLTRYWAGTFSGGETAYARFTLSCKDGYSFEFTGKYNDEYAGVIRVNGQEVEPIYIYRYVDFLSLVVPVEAVHDLAVSDTKVEPTCTTEGCQSRYCKSCDYSTENETIPALGHDYTEVEGTAVAPTLDAAGKKNDLKCSRCGDVAAGKEIAKLIDVKNAEVTVSDVSYTGKKLYPSITVRVNGTRLFEGRDFTASYSNNTKAGTNAKVKITGIGNYGGTQTKSFVIRKAVNTLSVKAVRKTQTVKAGKKTTIKAGKAFKVVRNVSKGKVTYSKISGNGKITVSKNGKITVRKGLKKGKTYTVKVRAASAETAKYESANSEITIKIKAK